MKNNDIIVSVKMSGECEKCGEHALECECLKYKYRKYRRMNEKEQKATGYPTDTESIKYGVCPISILLGYDPFITFDEIISTDPPNVVVKYCDKSAFDCECENESL